MIETIKRKLSGLFARDGEDRGVSPVIGVILMVAITVILAAVIGAFVLDLGGSLGTADTPTASVSAEENEAGDDVIFTHQTGDTIATSDLKIVVNGEQNEFTGSPDTFGAGTTISANDNGEGVDLTGTDATVSLVYDDGDSSVNLATIDVAYEV